MMRRAAVAVLSSLVLVGGFLVGASPASAANVGTVSVSYSSFVYSVTPSSLAGSEGDSFTLANTLTSGDNSANYYVALQNETGSVSLGGTSCSAATDCEVRDLFAGTASGVFTVITPGTLKVLRYYQTGPATQIGTLTITGGGSAVTDPALVYPTASIDPNGGTCIGALQFTKVNGQNGTITTPTSSTCTRPGYTLMGWARSADARSVEWAPDVTVPIGTDSFILYAVWAANGVEVTYDANVGLGTPCLADGVDLPTAAERRSTSVVTPVSAGQAVSVGSDGIVRWTSAAPASPCSPVGYTLAGWSTSPTGAVRAGGQANDIVTSGDGISSTGRAAPGADRLTLYAVWAAPTYGVSVTASETTLKPGESATVTVKSMINGAPAASAIVAVNVPATAPVTLSNGASTAMLTTGSSGEATVTVSAALVDAQGTATITVAYGNTTASVDITVGKAPTLTIVGKRTTVSGKPGIRVEGVATGLSPGSVVVPYIRFPGEVTYSQGTARPVVGANGEFFWERKTGKKVTVYVASEGGLQSNRVIIQAQ